MKNETIKVLLIDDDEDDYILTRELFSSVKISRYVLDWASSYDEGLKVARRLEHHVCLVDYHLGERNGVQLIREAQESRLTTPMILLTGEGDHDVDMEAMQAGATDYLVKDETSPARLERTIRYAVQLNTERCRAEGELRQSEARFRRVVESNMLGILYWDLSAKIVGANDAFLNMVGYTREDLDAGRMRWTDMTPSKYSELDEKALEQLATSGVCETYEKECICKDGRRISILLGCATLDGGKQSKVGFVLDISDRKRAESEQRKLEEQLRQSHKLESVGMLAGGIAHDFNNLLTVISGYAALTLGRLDKSDPLALHVEEIKKAAARATTLTRQLLAFSRKQLLQPKVLDLNSVILDLEKMLGRLIGEDMEIGTAPGVALRQVKADPGQIEQVILNLVVNARDAMPDGGKITLETANIYLDEEYARQHIGVEPGLYVMLAVTDTGRGMDTETRKHIFEPFFTTKEQGKGTGLGLSTVYGIVKQSGGNIWVYSEVGVGTSFKVYFPPVDEKVTEPDPDAARPESSAGSETILVAEDEAMVRSLARESLKTHGYTVLEAGNASEALMICKQYEGQIHLLLTDVVMPRMSGKELAELFVGFRPDTRVLYMSGYADQAIVHHGILDGDIAFIGKPFTPDALVLKVVEVLHQNVSPTRLLERIDSSTPEGRNGDGNSSQLNELDEVASRR